jgi:hypothetical protein
VCALPTCSAAMYSGMSIAPILRRTIVWVVVETARALREKIARVVHPTASATTPPIAWRVNAPEFAGMGSANLVKAVPLVQRIVALAAGCAVFQTKHRAVIRSW